VDPAEALLRFPARRATPSRIMAIERGAPHANARTTLFLDAYSGRCFVSRLTRKQLGHQACLWTLSWHTGWWAGSSAR